MNFAQTERAALCDLLAELGPGAPTLCDGWSTADLAAHLLVRENDVVAAPGIMVKPLAHLTDRRMGELLARLPYQELVARLAAGPSTWSVFNLPGIDAAANALEYFVHHEDVRRANGATEPRELRAEDEDMIWRRLQLMARVLFRRAGVGIVLERHDRPADPIRAMPGSDTVTLIGKPSELILFGYGRTSCARVRRVGDDATLERLDDADLAL